MVPLKTQSFVAIFCSSKQHLKYCKSAQQQQQEQHTQEQKQQNKKHETSIVIHIDKCTTDITALPKSGRDQRNQ